MPFLFLRTSGGIVHDPVRRKDIQVDVAVLGPAVPGEPRRVLSVGEAKLGDVMGARHVQRLRRARDLLGERGYDTSETILACYSGAGFSREIAEDTDGERIALIGPRELYGDVS